MNREFMEIDTNMITRKTRLRNDYGDLAMLEKSIQKLGVLCPLIIDSDNVLISGERRLQACRNVNITRIPAIKLDIKFNSITALDIQSDVNICREPFSKEELESHIEMKKSAITAKRPEQTNGFWGGLRKIFNIQKVR